MATKYRLSPPGRDFLQLVERAALVNPFTEERKRINMRLSGLSDKFTELQQNEKGVKSVIERFKRLEETGRDNFNQGVWGS
ncbi:hypothetical protein D1BOALGB6SA_5509 [Olavius sp. associated proteobacterium Delta 1]|nr:hypothetical protein D1BOALGB6SA_5509 [Olavius sp. associated proteobacterium Delta 1]